MKSDDWDRLIQKVIELSGGYAKQDLTPDAYKSLEWDGRNRLKGYRNWVDLYDTLLLQWFFFHRSEDACRLVGEEYRLSDGDWVCYLYETKGDRDTHETHSYRNEHKKFMARLKKRKPSGYLVFPQYMRPEKNHNGSQVGETLNFLLKHAAGLVVDPEITLTNGGAPANKLVWTHIRHTAFRVTLEDRPELGNDGNIDTFAANGHTSAREFRDTYVKDIKLAQLAKESREAIPERSWAMVRRVTP